MPAPQMFHGLARLAARAGFKMNAETGKPENTDDTDRDDEGEIENEDDRPDGEPETPETPPADPAGDPPADDEDETNGEDDDTGTGEDAPDEGTEANVDAPKRSADFRAGERYGAQQTAGRWAAVLASPVGRANLEMATDLLATSSMSPSAIVEHCDKYKGSSAAKTLLDTTKKVNLGVEGNTEKDPGAEARKASVERTNARLGGGGRRGAKKAKGAAADAGGPVIRRSRRAAAAGTTPASK